MDISLDQITIHGNIIQFRDYTFNIIDSKYIQIGTRAYKIPEPRKTKRGKKYFVDIQLYKIGNNRKRIYKYFETYEEAKEFAMKIVLIREFLPKLQVNFDSDLIIIKNETKTNKQGNRKSRVPKIEKYGRKWRIRRFENGKWKIYTFDNFDEALAFQKELEKEIQGKRLLLSDAIKIFGEYLYLRKQDMRKVKNYMYFLSNFIKKWGDIEFSKITELMLEKYIVERLNDINEKTKKPINETTVRSEISRLSTLWNYLIRAGYVKGQNFAEKVLKERKLKEKIRERVLSYNEIINLLKGIQSLPCEKTWNQKKAFILIGFFTGARKEEVLRLRKEHIRLANDETGKYGIIYFTNDITKTGKNRKIDIPYEFALWLLKNCGDEKMLFPDFQNSYQKRKLLEWFKDFLKSCKIENFYYHDFRHTWATLASEIGLSDRIIAKLGGWKSLTSVGRYINIRKEYKANPVNHIFENLIQEIQAKDLQNELKLLPGNEKKDKIRVPKIEQHGKNGELEPL